MSEHCCSTPTPDSEGTDHRMTENTTTQITPVPNNGVNTVEVPTPATTVKSIEELKAEVEDLQAKLTIAERRANNAEDQVERERNTRQHTQNSLNTARQDWATLNEFLNDYADEQSMCSAYENQLSIWNNSFSMLELTGREKEYEVSVTVTATYYTTVTVTASSDEAAQEHVDDNYDEDDIMRNATWSAPDDTTWEVTDVSEA